VVRDLVSHAHADGLVALGVESLAGLADPLHAVAREDRLHLLEHGAHALGERGAGIHAQRALDAVERLEPLAQERVARLLHAPVDVARQRLRSCRGRRAPAC